MLNFSRALILAFGLMRLDAQLAIKEGIPALITELDNLFAEHSIALPDDLDHHESLRWDRLAQGNMTKLIQALLHAAEYDEHSQGIIPLIDGMIFKRAEAT